MTFSARSLFSKPTKDEARAREERIKKGQEEITRLTNLAKACLESDQFKEYAIAILKGKNTLFDVMMSIERDTIEGYGIAFIELRAKYEVLLELLRKVEKDLALEDRN